MCDRSESKYWLRFKMLTRTSSAIRRLCRSVQCQRNPQVSEVLPTEEILIKLLLLFERKNLLGTPETSLRGLSTLNVLRVDRSSLAPPSSVFGSSIGRNLVTSAELAHEYILLLYKEDGGGDGRLVSLTQTQLPRSP